MCPAAPVATVSTPVLAGLSGWHTSWLPEARRTGQKGDPLAIRQDRFRSGSRAVAPKAGAHQP